LVKHLHIVCFDVPYPPDYGGVIDVFYRIKALHDLGVKIHLHCYEYGRKRDEVLNQFCATVQYYRRDTGITGMSFRIPYIVYSRRNRQLQDNLLKDGHPILFEGIHCTWPIYKYNLHNRVIAVRLHNVEHEYYRELAKNERSFFKKIYYSIESALLKKYERKIASKAMLLAITQKEADVYKSDIAAKDVRFLPASLPFNSIECRAGKNEYCLYHGNLSIAENKKAVEWLCTVFGNTEIPLIIAGRSPGQKLRSIIAQYKNISLISDPSAEKMHELISNAHVNVLPAFQSTGIKLKLLYALFAGRHCIINDTMVNGTGLEKYCHIANNPGEFINAVQKLLNDTFTTGDVEKRKELLALYDNTTNAELLMKWIYSHYPTPSPSPS
jgi:glycosyltransferase involved in cell wall biosynthesis